MGKNHDGNGEADLVQYTYMTLTKEDVQLITSALQPQFDQLQQELKAFRLEVRETFQAQGERLARAIADAVKLMAKAQADTKAELEELRNELEDYKKRLQNLEQRVSST